MGCKGVDRVDCEDGLSGNVLIEGLTGGGDDRVG